MGTDIDVSVVMGVFNGGTNLARSIDSILAQEGVSLELIIVNDGSTDRCGDILEGYASADDRVRVIHQENLGLTRALVRGCLESRAEYIARHDAGDLSAPNRLALQKRALDQHTDVAFVSCWSEFLGPELEFLYLVRGAGLSSVPVSIISDDQPNGVIDGPSCHGSVMFRKEHYLEAGGYRPQFYYGQDWDLWYRLAELGKFQMIEQRLYSVLVFPDGMSVANKSMQESLGRLSREALRLRRHGASEEAILAAASMNRRAEQRAVGGGRSAAAGNYFIGECLRRNGDRRSVDYLGRSVLHWPLSVRHWIRLLQAWLSFKRPLSVWR